MNGKILKKILSLKVGSLFFFFNTNHINIFFVISNCKYHSCDIFFSIFVRGFGLSQNDHVKIHTLKVRIRLYCRTWISNYCFKYGQSITFNNKHTYEYFFFNMEASYEYFIIKTNESSLPCIRYFRVILIYIFSVISPFI